MTDPEFVPAIQRIDELRSLPEMIKLVIDTDTQFGAIAQNRAAGALESRQLRALNIHFDQIYPGHSKAFGHGVDRVGDNRVGDLSLDCTGDDTRARSTCDKLHFVARQ